MAQHGAWYNSSLVVKDLRLKDKDKDLGPYTGINTHMVLYVQYEKQHI